MSEDLSFALSLAETADEISRARFEAADLKVETKPDSTFVTDADQAVEAAIRKRIETQRPNDGFFGEESGTGLNKNFTREWIIDPIDGTSNFMRGIPNWATLIALSVDKKPTIGVVSAPAFGCRWWAEIGSGAWKQIGQGDPQKISVSGVKELQDASLSFQSIAQWRDAGYLQELLSLSNAVWRDRAYGDMWSYMLLAEGLLEIVAEFDVKPYDLAALMPIVEEAGGRFTDIQGNASVWNDSSLATNSHLHEAVVQHIKSFIE